MLTIETAVCSAASRVMCGRGTGVSVCELYEGRTNIPFVRALARNVCFHVMHFHFGFSYAVIAQRSGLGEKSVMRCVRKFHMYSRYDRHYMAVCAMLEGGLLHEG